MRYKSEQDTLNVGVNEARQFATTYRLDEDNDSLMVVEEVNNLELVGRSFHLGVVTICVCRSGELKFSINGKPQVLSAGRMYINFGDMVVSNVSKSNDFSATAIVVSHDFLQESVMSLMHLWPYLLYITENPVVELGEMEMQRVIMNYRLIIERLTQKDHAYRREATIANLQACYLDVCDCLNKKVTLRAKLQQRSYGIFDQFVRLVVANYVQHRDVQWYADAMQITPKYLSEVVKDVSGRTSSQWIANFVVTELKSLLRNTDLSIKEIAVEMNFANQSFLGKYFKNIVGKSPVEYRMGK